MSRSRRSRDKSRKNRAAKARRVAIPKNPRLVRKSTDVPLSFDVKLDLVPAGFAAEDCAPGATPVMVLSRGFLTTDHGDVLYTYLDEISKMVLNRPFGDARIGRHLVHNFLINITNSTQAKIYANFTTNKQIIIKGNQKIDKSQSIFENDIADVRSVDFPQFAMPTEGAIVYSFHEGWRQSLYFDFSMLPEEPTRPLRDLPTLFAQFHNLTAFRDLFRLEEDTLSKLYAMGWFPFIRISTADILNITRSIKAGIDACAPAQRIIDSITAAELDSMHSFWQNKSFYTEHAKSIETAVRHYTTGDYISASSVLMPRLEGILRQLYVGTGVHPDAPKLRDKLVDHIRNKVQGPTRFIPEQFRDYLKKFLYAGFDLDAGRVNFSRNSVAHGVTPEDQFDQVRALQLLLILDQIAFYW